MMKYYFAIFLPFVSFNAHAQLHKWVDSNGKVHYSDEPPPSNATDSKTLNIQSYSQTESAASGPAAPKTIFEREAEMNKEQKEKQKTEQKAAKEEQDAKIKQQNCQQSQNRMRTLLNAPRLSTYDTNGNRTIMDDDARKQAEEDAQAAIDKYCD